MGYYTDRNFGAIPRTSTELDGAVCRGILGLLRMRSSDGSFGFRFAEQCPDGRGPIGTDVYALRDALAAHRLFNFVDQSNAIPTMFEVLDLIEFAFENIAEPRQGDFHPFFGHYHLAFSQAGGRAALCADINRVFERNGIAFELRNTGRVERIAPEVLREALGQATFLTGDDILDEMLEGARSRFLSSRPATRKESLEALWDAWERLKSLEVGASKRESTARILDKGSGEPHFRDILEAESRALTDIGNGFLIRHTEVNKTPIVDDEHVDFLFHRLFALIRLLLRKSGRGG